MLNNIYFIYFRVALSEGYLKCDHVCYRFKKGPVSDPRINISTHTCTRIHSSLCIRASSVLEASSVVEAKLE